MPIGAQDRSSNLEGNYLREAGRMNPTPTLRGAPMPLRGVVPYGAEPIGAPILFRVIREIRGLIRLR